MQRAIRPIGDMRPRHRPVKPADKQMIQVHRASLSPRQAQAVQRLMTETGRQRKGVFVSVRQLYREFVFRAAEANRQIIQAA